MLCRERIGQHTNRSAVSSKKHTVRTTSGSSARAASREIHPTRFPFHIQTGDRSLTFVDRLPKWHRLAKQAVNFPAGKSRRAFHPSLRQRRAFRVGDRQKRYNRSCILCSTSSSNQLCNVEHGRSRQLRPAALCPSSSKAVFHRSRRYKRETSVDRSKRSGHCSYKRREHPEILRRDNATGYA